jgi:AcrR family transcriptional regulator
MNHFGAEKLVLVGLSYGSWIATSFATRFPEKLVGLVLAGGCTGMSEADADEREAFRRSREVPLSQGQTPADFAPQVASLIAGPNASDAVREELLRSMAEISVETYRDALTCFTNPLEQFDFARILCPVTLVTGEHDTLAPPSEIRRVGERIRDRGLATRGLSDVCFEVLNDAGHVCNLEQPDAFNDILGRFLERLPGVSANYKPSREEKRQKKRRRILEAALEEFCAAGFDGASMDRLAQAADVSKPTLYRYFEDKESLFSAVLDRGKRHIIAPLFDTEGVLVDRLWHFSWTYAEFVLRPDMLSLARLILSEASRRPEIARRYHESGPGSALDGLEKFVGRCVANSEIAVDDARLAANDLWSLTLSGPRDYYLHHTSERPTETELLHAIDHGLRVFLKAYSTQPDADLSVLSSKVAEKRRGLENVVHA